MNVLLIGDITGRPGRDIIVDFLPKIKRDERIDFVIANAENVAGGSGITQDTANELLDMGVDVLTSGDHIWKQKQILDIIDSEKRILRPANYPKNNPGRGAAIYKSESGVTIGVLNLLGRVFLDSIGCPFKSAREHIDELKKETDIIFVDFHAEATSEKIALGWYLDGEVTGVCGTHTHVQTADERILPNGTAYITDLGMTGPFNSVIGRKKEQILERFITRMPVRFQVAEGDVRINGAIISVDDKTHKATSIKRFQIARD